MRGGYKTVITGFLALYLAGSLGLFAVLFVPTHANTLAVGSTPTFIAVWAVCYAITLILVVCQRTKFDSGDALIFIIPGYFLLSSLWSLNPSKTFTYATVLVLNALFVCVLKRYISPEQFPRFVLKIILSLCVLGTLAAFSGYQNALYIDDHDRQTFIGTEPIRGFFNHKITAGYYAAIAALLAYYMLAGWYRIVAISFLLAFILLTGSVAALGLLFFGCLLIFTIRSFLQARVTPTLFISALFIFTFLAFSVFYIVGEDVLLLLNRDPTLTGRTLLWSWGIDVSLERFWLGWGYLGYNGTEVAYATARYFREFQNYLVPHFHNSYIQFLVEAGWVFGLGFILLYVFAALGWYKLALITGEKSFASILLILLFMMVAALFIHVLGRYNDFSMIVFMYALSCMPSYVHAYQKRQVWPFYKPSPLFSNPRLSNRLLPSP